MNKKEKVLGYDVNLITFDDSVCFLTEKMQSNTAVHVVTINPEIIEQAQKDSHLNCVINNAELVVPDGTGIQMALKFKGIKQERIPGVDLAYTLIKKCSELNLPVALIGAKEEVIQKAASNIKSSYPNLNICYFRNGYFKQDEEAEIIANIKESKPALVLVALGSPKQEFFIEKAIKEYANSVYIGIGGSFDVWAGVVDRAPEIYQKLGCEWIYRTMKQPERLKRIYKTLPAFLFKAIIESLKYRVCMCRKGKND